MFCFFLVPTFSEWHEYSQANYGSRVWPFSHSFGLGYGSHKSPFWVQLVSGLVGFAQKSGLWQQGLAFFPQHSVGMRYGSHKQYCMPRSFGLLVVRVCFRRLRF